MKKVETCWEGDGLRVQFWTESVYGELLIPRVKGDVRKEQAIIEMLGQLIQAPVTTGNPKN